MTELLTRDFIFKFIKFGLVGFTGMGVDFGVTYVSKEYLRMPKYIANALGFVVAATTNYALNRIWTFRSANPNMVGEFLVFFLVSVTGLALNTIVLYYIHHHLRVNFYVAKLVATGIVLFWNFGANNFITFAP